MAFQFLFGYLVRLSSRVLLTVSFVQSQELPQGTQCLSIDQQYEINTFIIPRILVHNI